MLEGNQWGYMEPPRMKIAGDHMEPPSMILTPLPFRGNNSTYPGPKPTKNDDGNIMGSLGVVRSTSTPIRIRVWDSIDLVELIDHPHAKSISCDYGK